MAVKPAREAQPSPSFVVQARPPALSPHEQIMTDIGPSAPGSKPMMASVQHSVQGGRAFVAHGFGTSRVGQSQTQVPPKQTDKNCSPLLLPSPRRATARTPKQGRRQRGTRSSGSLFIEPEHKYKTIQAASQELLPFFMATDIHLQSYYLYFYVYTDRQTDSPALLRQNRGTP